MAKKRKTTRQAPSHLSKPCRDWWREVVTEFELDSQHERILTLACEAWDRGVQAREILANEGLTYLDRFNQPRARPEVAIERDSRIAFARLVRELGLDYFEPDDSRPPRVGGQS